VAKHINGKIWIPNFSYQSKLLDIIVDRHLLFHFTLLEWRWEPIYRQFHIISNLFSIPIFFVNWILFGKLNWKFEESQITCKTRQDGCWFPLEYTFIKKWNRNKKWKTINWTDDYYKIVYPWPWLQVTLSFSLAWIVSLFDGILSYTISSPTAGMGASLLHFQITTFACLTAFKTFTPYW